MKFLIVAQDLRDSGTSEGIVSRSFIAKLRKSYPNSIIDLVYLKFHSSDDNLHLLPINSIKVEVVNFKIPFYIKLLNKIYWRIFHESLNESFIQKRFATHLSEIAFKDYNFVFIRSSGLEYESILGAKDLPILKKSYINFHDPYPVFWCAGNKTRLSELELFRLKKMHQVIRQAKGCFSPAHTLTHDMKVLYNSYQTFYTIPHQFDKSVFDFKKHKNTFIKKKPISICYHGAIQFGRSLTSLLDIYLELINSNKRYGHNTEFIVRVKSMEDVELLNKKYANIENIRIYASVYFWDSSFEQAKLADINIILDNGTTYSNILVGKAPYLAYIRKPILCITPKHSELRRIIENEKYLAETYNKEDIKRKLKFLINERMVKNEPTDPFGDYFSDENFKQAMDSMLFNE